MPKEKYTKTNTHKILLAIIFILVIGFGFGKGEKAEAADGEDTTLGLCYNRYTEFDAASGLPLTVDDDLGTMTKNACIAAATESQSRHGGGDMIWNPVNQETNTTNQKTQTVVKDPGKSLSCSFLLDPIDCTLLTLLELFVWLITLASTLFSWIMEPANISSILSSKAIYEGWSLVRDALNVSFIMFLLFSAFATVFQIDKYSYKNILRTLVIMALLVNFSFPISRFVIDVSNMMMYYFADTLTIDYNKADAIVNFASVSDLPGILHPTVGKDNTTSLLAAVVFAFIFMVTMLTISVLFVIRTLALAVLIIFSSLAFVGTAVPPLAKHSSDWWKKLFDYSFFGPIMLFMMYIASSLMNEIQKDGLMNLTELATKNTTVAPYIASLAFFSLPIIILWIGLGIAKEMSGSAGSAIVGKAQGFMKGAGKWTASAPWRATKMAAKQTGVPGAMKQRWDQYKKESFFGSEKQAQREAKRAAFLGVKGAEEKDMRRRAEEHKKNFTTDSELETLAAGGDAAAAYRLAEDKKMKQDTYDKFVANAKDKTGSLKKSINDKVKQNRADLVITNKVTTMTPTEIADTRTEAVSKGIVGAATWTPDQVKNYVAEQETGKLNAEKYSDQDWAGITKDLIDPATGLANPDKERIVRAAAWGFANLAPAAKNEIKKRMSAANRMALISAGNSLTPPVIIAL